LLCEGIGTDVPDRSTAAAPPDGFYNGNVDEGLKGRSDAINPSAQNQPTRPLQMNVAAPGNHPFPKSFLDGDFEFVSFFCIGVAKKTFFFKAQPGAFIGFFGFFVFQFFLVFLCFYRLDLIHLDISTDFFLSFCLLHAAKI